MLDTLRNGFRYLAQQDRLLRLLWRHAGINTCHTSENSLTGSHKCYTIKAFYALSAPRSASPQCADEAAAVALGVEGDGVTNVEEGGRAVGIHWANIWKVAGHRALSPGQQLVSAHQYQHAENVADSVHIHPWQRSGLSTGFVGIGGLVETLNWMGGVRGKGRR